MSDIRLMTCGECCNDGFVPEVIGDGQVRYTRASRADCKQCGGSGKVKVLVAIGPRKRVKPGRRKNDAP